MSTENRTTITEASIKRFAQLDVEIGYLEAAGRRDSSEFQELCRERAKAWNETRSLLLAEVTL